MTWPAAQVKTSFDQSSDDPKSARSEIAGNVDKFNLLQAHVSSYVQGLLDDADAAAARTTLDTQKLDATLTSLAAVAGVAGDILYASGTDAWARLAKGSDGDILTLASGIPSWSSARLIRRTPIATTSGGTHSFASILPGCNRLTFMFENVSLSGNDRMRLQIGDAGGIETSGYEAGASSGASPTESNEGFVLHQSTGSSLQYHGSIILTRFDGNLWVSQGNLHREASNEVQVSAGSKTLTAELTEIQVDLDGSNTFDAGSVALIEEYG